MSVNIKKVIFDNDGVNADSEHLAMQVMDDAGYDLVTKYKPDAVLARGDIYTEYPGTSTDAIVRKLIERFDLQDELIRADYNIEDGADVAVEIAADITAETIRRFETELKAIPHVTEALEQIRTIYGAENIALCTTSSEDRMDVTLDHAVDAHSGANARLSDIFPKGDQRISGYGHENKYKLFQNIHNWEPAETAIVEDSISGVTKAKAAAADFTVVGTVAAGFYKDKAGQAEKLMNAGATAVVSDIRDLPSVLKNIDNLDTVKATAYGTIYTPLQLTPAAKNKPGL